MGVGARSAIRRSAVSASHGSAGIGASAARMAFMQRAWRPGRGARDRYAAACASVG
ncbi:hypothetical protein BURMUCF2_A2272 [Burkholderia multivorans CF2]|nr:hypothetical protein BURMUCF2_A2272 [Burkholderia multivorans CF2]